MGSHEQAVIELESGAVSALVTNHSFTSFSKTCNISSNKSLSA